MTLIYILCFTVLTIGNAEWLVASVNRVHALPLSFKLLDSVRVVHDLVMFAFPMWLLIGLGFVAPGVFVNDVPLAETWRRLPMMVQAYFGLCGLGFVGFSVCVARHWLARTPTQHVAFKSRVIDLATELGRAPVGDGPFQSLLRVPGNECFRVEFNERTLHCEQLPREWDGLRILHLSDLHFIGTLDLPFFERLIEHAQSWPFDVAVFTGDLLDDMRFHPWIAQTLGRIRAPLGNFFILGNHDWNLDTTAIRTELAAVGWTDLGSRCEVLRRDGQELLLGGSEVPWLGTQPDFEAANSDGFRILLSHSPDSLSWARRNGVGLMLSGHTHGGQIVLPGIGPVYSPSMHGCRFAGGLFWKAPTVLFVSRGVSGRHPLRIRCRPEVTLLELNSGK